MIKEEVLELSGKILEQYKVIRESNEYELAFVYDFWSSKANSLKVTKRNDDFIMFTYDMGLFDIEVCEDEGCTGYFGCEFEEALELFQGFMNAKIYVLDI